MSSGFDAKDISEDADEDQEGLDVSAAHVANLLSTEPCDGMFLNMLRNVTATYIIYIKLLRELCSMFPLS